jgi:hypothetical protein
MLGVFCHNRRTLMGFVLNNRHTLSRVQVLPYTVWGDNPPWAVAPPIYLPQERVGTMIIRGVCVCV